MPRSTIHPFSMNRTAYKTFTQDEYGNFQVGFFQTFLGPPNIFGLATGSRFMHFVKLRYVNLVLSIRHRSDNISQFLSVTRTRLQQTLKTSGFFSTFLKNFNVQHSFNHRAPFRRVSKNRECRNSCMYPDRGVSPVV